MAHAVYAAHMHPSLEACGAVLFDLDGVITPTASLHSRAWKETFDRFLAERASATHEPFREFTETDYIDLVDGKPRIAGVRSFLDSRGIRIPAGTPNDPPGTRSIHGLAAAKDARFNDLLSSGGVAPYPGSLALLRSLRANGTKTAVVSSSRNCSAVLAAAGITDLFDASVDGVEREKLHLRGKPAPDTYLRAAELTGYPPPRCAVVEDAVAGVEAGRAGGFGLVIGVDRHHHPEELSRHGADVVVSDLAELADGSIDGATRDDPTSSSPASS